MSYHTIMLLLVAYWSLLVWEWYGYGWTVVSYYSHHTRLSHSNNRLLKLTSAFALSNNQGDSSDKRAHDGDDGGDDESDDARLLAKALARSHPSQTAWYSQSSCAGGHGLPFECTECGKCCKTRGSVYMSPIEVGQAAHLLNMTTTDFVAAYASRTVHQQQDGKDDDNNDGDGDNPASSSPPPWVKLINNNEGACIFLNQETNQCTIYNARPSQCSTYPFWPNILKSRHSWNAEVRLPDDAVSNHDDIPYWTPHVGGCEGMKRIDNDDDDSAVFAMEQSSTVRLVSPYEAFEQLMEYERNERSFPTEPVLRRVKRKRDK